MAFSQHVQTVRLFRDQPLLLHSGAQLDDIAIAYETYGSLNSDRSNAVLVCHALTGDSHLARHSDSDQPGWWDGTVGPGRLIDTHRFFVICPNVLGSCYGSEGPPSIRKGTQEPWGDAFPYPTVADVVASQAALLDHLGIERLALVIGGSLGGQQALRWAVQYPGRVGACIAIACDERASAWVIALQDVGRQAIHNALQYPQIPELLDQALATARMISMISYRTPVDFGERFERSEVDAARRAVNDLRYEVESYLRYQGSKLVRRFEARAYLRLTRMLDSFDVSEGFASMETALAQISAPVAVVGIDSDMLFEASRPQRLAGRLRNLGITARFHLLASRYGHDAFLIEHEKLDGLLRPFVDEFAGAKGQ